MTSPKSEWHFQPVSELKGRSKQLKKLRSQWAKKTKQKTPRDLDTQFSELHESAFEQYDCLTCANCCKTTSPMLFEKDIERLSKALGMKPGDFTQTYLYLDTDGLYAFKQTPCPFLGPDNYCQHYEDRPKACREFPHTQHRKMHNLLNLAVTNCSVCPVVDAIVDKLAGIQA